MDCAGSAVTVDVVILMAAALFAVLGGAYVALALTKIVLVIVWRMFGS